MKNRLRAFTRNRNTRGCFILKNLNTHLKQQVERTDKGFRTFNNLIEQLRRFQENKEFVWGSRGFRATKSL